MTVDLKKARDFIYANGLLWEQALYAYHFEGGGVERLHQIWLCYKNPDNGFGHALEPDIRYPRSHPLPLEFMLGVLQQHEFPIGNTLLAGTPEWVMAHQAEDGSLINPPDLLDYPHAPWWAEGGQTIPDSITGNLLGLGICPPALAAKTFIWVEQNLTIEKIRAVDWLFMNYHAHDYFFNVTDFPDLEAHRQATIETIIACAEKAPETQYPTLFSFCRKPDSPVTQAFPPDLLKRALDFLMDTQQEDGGWHDEHGLPQWYAYTAINNLVTLRRFGRL